MTEGARIVGVRCGLQNKLHNNSNNTNVKYFLLVHLVAEENRELNKVHFILQNGKQMALLIDLINKIC